MTPDAAFGHERAGTPETVAALGAVDGFEVVVVPPFALDGREVRSSDIRAAIASGDLAQAERLLGRPYAVVGDLDPSGVMTFAMPVALPPAGDYHVADGDVTERLARVRGATVTVVNPERAPRSQARLALPRPRRKSRGSPG